MLPYIKQEFSVYYHSLKIEFQTASSNLESLQRIANEVKENVDQQISTNKAIISDQELKSLKLLISICEKLENFNNDLELCFNGIHPIIHENIVKSLCLPLLEPRIIFKCDLSAYMAGTVGECVITYFKDLKRDLCFIVDVERSPVEQNNFYKEVVSRLEGPPKHGVIYGIDINQKILRGIRVRDESSTESYQYNLIDTGEMIKLPKICQTIYHLSEKARYLSPAAILCLVEKLDGQPIDCLKRISAKKQFLFRVNTVCTNMLHIELSPKDDNRTSSRPRQSLYNICQPTYRNGTDVELLMNPAEPINMNFLQSPETMASNTFPRIDYRNSMSRDLLDETNTDDMNKQRTNSHLKQNLSQIELNSLQAPFFNQASPFSMSKPQSSTPVAPTQHISSAPAVESNSNDSPASFPPFNANQSMNRSYEDDSADIINNNSFDFMDSPKSMDINSVTSTPSPFSCYLNHTSRCLTGAHSKDNSLLFNQSINDDLQNDTLERISYMNLPAVGETITILPTFVLNVEQFFAQIAVKPGIDKFMELQKRLNQSIDSLRPIDEPLSPGHLVLARYSVDNTIYRAKVQEACDLHNIQVFYVDFGNVETVPFDSLYQWQPFCNALQFQSVLCVIPNVRMRKENDYEATEFLVQKIVNKHFEATVKSNDGGKLVIHLSDSEGFDIGEELCAKELALIPNE